MSFFIWSVARTVLLVKVEHFICFHWLQFSVISHLLSFPVQMSVGLLWVYSLCRSQVSAPHHSRLVIPPMQPASMDGTPTETFRLLQTEISIIFRNIHGLFGIILNNPDYPLIFLCVSSVGWVFVLGWNVSISMGWIAVKCVWNQILTLLFLLSFIWSKI